MSLIVLLFVEVPSLRVTAGVVSITFTLFSLVRLLSPLLLLMNLLSILSKAHLGYLHLVRAFLR